MALRSSGPVVMVEITAMECAISQHMRRAHRKHELDQFGGVVERGGARRVPANVRLACWAREPKYNFDGAQRRALRHAAGLLMPTAARPWPSARRIRSGCPSPW